MEGFRWLYVIGLNVVTVPIHCSFFLNYCDGQDNYT